MRQLLITSLLLTVLLQPAVTCHANSAAAGEIVYTHLRDSTYRVIFRLYTDCSGNAAPATATFCINDSCSNNSFSRIVPRYTGLIRNNTVPNGSETPISCTPKEPTKCTDLNSALPGYREWWYVDTITLPSRCTGWRLSTTINSRNNNNNLYNGNFYVETYFNNQLSLSNSSPDFTFQSLMFVCLNQPFTYNIGATDADGDSLDIKVVPSKTAPVFTCPVSPDTPGIIAANPPYNWNNNPFQTQNTFTLNNGTGEMKFYATSTGSSIRTNALAVRINEYRNGQLIGSVHRDMQIYVFDCSRVVPLGGIFVDYEFKRYEVPGGEQNGTIWAQTGQPIHLVYTATSNDPDAEIILSDNHDSVFTNSILYYIDNRSNNPEGHFFWTPGVNDIGYHNLEVYITDSACRPPGSYINFMSTSSIVVSLGVSDVIGDNGIKIYPNPNNGIFNVLTGGRTSATTIHLNVINLFGQSVYATDNYHNEQIDISGIAPGMYILLLHDGEKQSKTNFVVQ